MSARFERIVAREHLYRCVLEVLLIERSLASDDTAAATLPKAEELVDLAARDLANAVAEANPDDRPQDWDLTPGGDTA